ncbi:hypothetical protein [Thalassotalea piscium]|uniref:Uncharacterized protein n=1 Tax=Thalassotalea piscium TaxID=1230533 RepID=A0A7X0NI37_9GAMM|nr:hypothetical protein [Thalassotalea piscium]MBB6543835.1 hypothetical protein [Thalassotalea piscium]
MWTMQEHYCPEQLVMKINALYLTVFTAYKIDHLINETGIKVYSIHFFIGTVNSIR